MTKLLSAMFIVLSLALLCSSLYADVVVYDVDNPNTPMGCLNLSSSQFTSIQAAVNALGAENPQKIIVCPGVYEENILARYNHIESYSKNPRYTVIQALNPNKTVIINPRYLTGFTITGAIGNGPCSGDSPIMYDNDPTSADYYPQPCSGVRVLCRDTLTITDNIFKGNNIGINIKDSNTSWYFNVTITENDIFDNNVGVKLHYGYGSHIMYNYIHDNSYIYPSIYGTSGILLVGTYDNEISGNAIKYNTMGVKLVNAEVSSGATYDAPAFNNIILRNSFINNDTNADDGSSGPNYWDGNYWLPVIPSIDHNPCPEASRCFK